MRITNTNGNQRNGIRGSRVTIYDNDNNIVDRFVVPTMYCNAAQYCYRHPTGQYGKRFFAAIEAATKQHNTRGN